MNNMDLYNAFRSVPEEALKPITTGRLKGFSDINPMWRIKVLTEQFGPCGIGWYYDVTDKHIDTVDKEIVATVQIAMYVCVGGTWSKPIVGIGGSKMATVEKNGVYVSDECYKMALTDALSVACKSLGIAADVYYSKDRTKYTASEPEEKKEPEVDLNSKITVAMQNALIAEAKKRQNYDEAKFLEFLHVSNIADVTIAKFKQAMAKMGAT